MTTPLKRLFEKPSMKKFTEEEKHIHIEQPTTPVVVEEVPETPQACQTIQHSFVQGEKYRVGYRFIKITSVSLLRVTFVGDDGKERAKKLELASRMVEDNKWIRSNDHKGHMVDAGIIAHKWEDKEFIYLPIQTSDGFLCVADNHIGSKDVRITEAPSHESFWGFRYVNDQDDIEYLPDVLKMNYKQSRPTHVRFKK